MSEYIISFDRIGREDIPTEGGKGANLGKMAEGKA